MRLIHPSCCIAAEDSVQYVYVPYFPLPLFGRACKHSYGGCEAGCTVQLLFIVHSMFSHEAGCQRVPLHLRGCAVEPGTTQANPTYPSRSPPAKPCVAQATVQLTTTTAV